MLITMIINLSDTLCIKGLAQTCQSYNNQSVMTWQPVVICAAICLTVVIIVLSWISFYYKWKAKEREIQHDELVEKRTWEKEDRESKNTAVQQTKTNDEKDLYRKQKEDQIKREQELEDRVLTILEKILFTTEVTKTNSKEGIETKEINKYNSDSEKMFKEQLNQIITKILNKKEKDEQKA